MAWHGNYMTLTVIQKEAYFGIGQNILKGTYFHKSTNITPLKTFCKTSSNCLVVLPNAGLIILNNPLVLYFVKTSPNTSPTIFLLICNLIQLFI